MQDIASINHGKCISTIYINSTTHLEWECSEGHIWRSTPNSIKNGSWCQKCFYSRQKIARFTIQNMQEIAEKRGGKCLSDTYINAKSHMKWQCCNEHIWMANPNNIKRGKWCPKCAFTTKITIDDMKELALLKGGLCLSEQYKKTVLHLEWQCSKGHTWKATPSSIKTGHWCPICARIRSTMVKHTINDMQDIAEKRGGKCLSKVYKNSTTPLEWRCSKEHEWKARPSSIKYGSWCPTCGRCRKKSIDQKKIKTLINLHKYAKFNGGECLSNKYTDIATDLNWICSEGHTFYAPWRKIRSGYWCPLCHGKFVKKEEISRLLFEEITGYSFPKCRPIFLKNPATGYKLELDGYCKELSLAFEYQGVQHYKNTPTFHRFENSLSELKNRDELKKKLCKENGIELIEVSYEIQIDSLSAFISTSLRKKHPNFKLKNIRISDLKMGKSKIEKMKEIAINNNGKCLSKTYIDNSQHLEWECAYGHIWKASPSNIKGGKWCPVCAGTKKMTIDLMKEIAESRGGQCLSDIYINAVEHLKWKCANGHIWEAIPSTVKKGSWCAKCAHATKITIDDMKALSSSKGGACLSSSYKSTREKLKWKCKKGHEWSATSSTIKKGSWCPQCARIRSTMPKYTIQDMKNIAEDRGGKCLSEIYTNTTTHLEWRCVEGHEWKTTLATIKMGHWCPKCGFLKKGRKKSIT